MKFSFEELYFMYGQYDSFVSLHFCAGTESEAMFEGNYIMGTFVFTNPERIELEKLRGTDIPRTENRIKFSPAKSHSFLERINTYLDRDGFLCSDICKVEQVMLDRQNRYKTKGEKDIPGTLKVDFDARDFCAQKAQLWLFSQRLKNGWPLRVFEILDYYGLLLFFNPDEINEKKDIYSNFETRELLPSVRFRFLKTKYFVEELNEEENAEFQHLITLLGKERSQILKREFQRATESLDELKGYPEQVRVVYGTFAQFEDETLVQGAFPIWWDYERFLHIYLRHVKETQLGSKYDGKTVFQYRFQDVRRIITIVLESLEDQVIEHFANTTAVFVRRGGRAPYYDGHYYRVDIEPSGRLLTFHPYNDDREREADN